VFFEVELQATAKKGDLLLLQAEVELFVACGGGVASEYADSHLPTMNICRMEEPDRRRYSGFG